MKKNLMGIAVLATACLSATSFAQDKNFNPQPDALKAPLVFSSPLGTFDVTPSELNKDRFNINATLASVVTILKSLAEKGGLTLILSDELKAQSPHVFLQLRQMTARDAIERICDEHGLAWGKSGADTYIIVEAKPKLLTVYNASQLKGQKQVPVLPDADKPTPDAQPFEFNGQRYYHIPLQDGFRKAH